MPDPKPEPIELRFLVLLTIGIGLVTNLLQPITETFILHNLVWPPVWWSVLRWVSLAAMFVLALILRKGSRKLCIITWCCLWVSVLGFAIPRPS